MPRGCSGNFAVACVAVATAAGCQSAADEKEKAREEFREAWAHHAPPGETQHPRSVLVAQGASPLVFQVLDPSVVHIMDTTTGAEIATTAAGKGALVYVSEDTGAFVNGDRLIPGPFTPGHRYGIAVDVEQSDSWDSKTRVATTPPPLPAATQPRGQ